MLLRPGLSSEEGPQPHSPSEEEVEVVRMSRKRKLEAEDNINVAGVSVSGKCDLENCGIIGADGLDQQLHPPHSQLDLSLGATSLKETIPAGADSVPQQSETKTATGVQPSGPPPELLQLPANVDLSSVPKVGR